MDEPISVRVTNEGDGEHNRWALVVGSEVVVEILTALSLPKARAVEYLFREMARVR